MPASFATPAIDSKYLHPHPQPAEGAETSFAPVALPPHQANVDITGVCPERNFAAASNPEGNSVARGSSEDWYVCLFVLSWCMVGGAFCYVWVGLNDGG
jgi:hypothetical protein